MLLAAVECDMGIAERFAGLIADPRNPAPSMSGWLTNMTGVWTIYRSEMGRMRRTIWQSVATPVITTMLYFIVFGGAIGSPIHQAAEPNIAEDASPSTPRHWF